MLDLHTIVRVEMKAIPIIQPTSLPRPATKAIREEMSMPGMFSGMSDSRIRSDEPPAETSKSNGASDPITNGDETSTRCSVQAITARASRHPPRPCCLPHTSLPPASLQTALLLGRTGTDCVGSGRGQVRNGFMQARALSAPAESAPPAHTLPPPPSQFEMA